MKVDAKTLDKIKRKSGSAVFSRGYDYYIKGRVGEILEIKNTIKADVIGTGHYTVTIVKSRDFKWKCTCPYGGLCKHIVAVFISLANNRNTNQIDTTKIEEYLLSKSHDELAEIIINHGISHTRFIKSLAIEANLYKERIDIPFFKKEIDSLLYTDYEVEYVHGYVQELEGFLNKIKPLIKKFPKETAEILHYFIVKSIDVFDDLGIDDSDGEYGDFIISLGEPFSEALKRSNYVFSPNDFIDTYFKAASYGLEDCFYPVFTSLPKQTLEDLEPHARESFNRVKDKKKSWESINERYFLAIILALLEKRKDYTEVCKGDKDLLEEIKDIEKEGKL